QYVDPGANAKAGLKSKAGWVGVALETGYNLHNNIKSGESKSKIIGDAAVDVAIGAGLIVLGTAVSALAVTLGAPVIA
ncbi:hypothetical protein, partial [Pseudomonas sp. 2822-17]|uniref:hypothetical protein n=1 Tax=Pseudomonas sp. 2822-17 TaxID=1712678 RepID=UPI001C488D41